MRKVLRADVKAERAQLKAEELKGPAVDWTLAFPGRESKARIGAAGAYLGCSGKWAGTGGSSTVCDAFASGDKRAAKTGRRA